MDTNGYGELTKKSFSDILTNLSEENIDQIFEACDLNNTGKIE